MKSWLPSEPSHEDYHGSGVQEGGREGDGRLGVLSEAPVSTDPGEEAFDDPAPRVSGEADLVRRLSHDLDVDQRGVMWPLAGEAHVGKDLLDEQV